MSECLTVYFRLYLQSSHTSSKKIYTCRHTQALKRLTTYGELLPFTNKLYLGNIWRWKKHKPKTLKKIFLCLTVIDVEAGFIEGFTM